MRKSLTEQPSRSSESKCKCQPNVTANFLFCVQYKVPAATGSHFFPRFFPHFFFAQFNRLFSFIFLALTGAEAAFSESFALLSGSGSPVAEAGKCTSPHPAPQLSALLFHQPRSRPPPLLPLHRHRVSHSPPPSIKLVCGIHKSVCTVHSSEKRRWLLTPSHCHRIDYAAASVLFLVFFSSWQAAEQAGLRSQGDSFNSPSKACPGSDRPSAAAFLRSRLGLALCYRSSDQGQFFAFRRRASHPVLKLRTHSLHSLLGTSIFEFTNHYDPYDDPVNRILAFQVPRIHQEFASTLVFAVIRIEVPLSKVVLLRFHGQHEIRLTAPRSKTRTRP